MARSIRLWLALGGALAALAACDQVQSRMDKLSKLADDVMKQVGGEALGQPQANSMASVPLDARALSGKRQPAAAIPVKSLQEELATESFFAVGSVIAKPKDDLTEPVVNDNIDLSAADNPATASAPAPSL